MSCRALHDLPSHNADPVYLVLQRCQQLLHQMATSPDDDEQQALHDAFHQAATELWLATESVLIQESKRWIKGVIGSEVDGAVDRLAQHMYTSILLELGSITVPDPRKTLATLRTVARRSMVNQYHAIYLGQPRPRRAPTKDTAVVPGTPEASMAPLPQSSDSRHMAYERDGERTEMVDPASLDAEDRLLEQLAARDLVPLVWHTWYQHADAVDKHIAEARLLADPPQPYEHILAFLGAGWTLSAIRQRTRRIRLALEHLLREHGVE